MNFEILETCLNLNENLVNFCLILLYYEIYLSSMYIALYNYHSKLPIHKIIF